MKNTKCLVFEQQKEFLNSQMETNLVDGCIEMYKGFSPLLYTANLHKQYGYSRRRQAKVCHPMGFEISLRFFHAFPHCVQIKCQIKATEKHWLQFLGLVL